MKSRKMTYFTPVEVKFTALQMREIVKENMDMWGLSEEQAVECNDEDVFLAAGRLGFIEIPLGARFDQ